MKPSGHLTRWILKLELLLYLLLLCIDLCLLFSRFVCDCPPELKFNVDAIDIMIRSHLLNMREFDLHLVQVWNLCPFSFNPLPLTYTTVVSQYPREYKETRIRQCSLLNTFFTVCFGLFRFQCIDNGHNLQALHFAIQLAKYVADEKHSPHVTEVSESIHKFSSLTTDLVPRVSHFPNPSLDPGEGRWEALETRLTQYL